MSVHLLEKLLANTKETKQISSFPPRRSVWPAGPESCIEPREKVARLGRVGLSQDALREGLRLRQIGAQHPLLDREQLLRVHREVPQAEAEQQARERRFTGHLAPHRG